MSDKGAEFVRRTPKPSKQEGRRNLLKAGIGSVAFLATAGLAAVSKWRRPDKIASDLDSVSQEEPEAPKKVEVSQINKQALNPIMAQEVSLGATRGTNHINPERSRLENDYVNSAQTLKQIDAGLAVAVDLHARAVLLEKRWQLRKVGKEGLKPLTQEQIDWASKEGIEPEAYAISIDVYPQALKTIELLFKTAKPQDLIPYPQTIAAIAKHETMGGWRYIGDTASSKVFKDEVKDSKERQALQELADYLKKDTGLDFDPNIFPSSNTGDIGFQFRPSTALEIYKTLADKGIKFNPYDPESGTLGAYVYLAMRGYDTTNPLKVQKALSGWNVVLGDKSDILRADSESRKIETPSTGN